MMGSDHGTRWVDDGHAVSGRGLDERKVANSRKRQVQGARDRCCRERQHVDRLAELFEALFVADSEPLLLVHDEKPEPGELDVPREEAVCPDDNVHCAGPEALQEPFLLPCGAKPAQRPDSHGIVGEPLLEGMAVLLDKNSRGGKDCHLLPVLDGLEGRSNGDLGLAVPHVSADQTVHQARRLHVALHVLGREPLVRRVLVEKGRLHLLLPERIGREGEPPGRGAPCVELQKLDRHRFDRLAGPTLEGLPALAADSVKRGGLGRLRLADPALYQVQPVDRHAEDFPRPRTRWPWTRAPHRRIATLSSPRKTPMPCSMWTTWSPGESWERLSSATAPRKRRFLLTRLERRKISWSVNTVRGGSAHLSSKPPAREPTRIWTPGGIFLGPPRILFEPVALAAVVAEHEALVLQRRGLPQRGPESGHVAIDRRRGSAFEL